MDGERVIYIPECTSSCQVSFHIIYLTIVQVMNLKESVSFLCVGVRMLSLFSHVQLLATPWTAAHQAPLSMDSLSKNTGVGCHAHH